MSQLPSVVAAGAATDLPLSVRERRAFTAESEAPSSAELSHVIANDWVLGRYFDALGIALKRGRYLQETDTLTSEPVIVINETMARMYWGDQDPIGQRIAWGGRRSRGAWMRIVGVVADVKQGPLNTKTVPQTYQPWQQVPDAFIANNIVGALRSLKIVVRSSQDPSALVLSASAQVRALDPALPIIQPRLMTDVVSASTSPQRFTTWLLGGFAAVALLLAALGIAGVLATAVSRRTHEIGVRMALGAQRRSLLAMVLRQGMTFALAGLAIGIAGALALSRVMASLLFEISPRDPMTFAGVAAVLAFVALAACYLPARRATRVDPMVALRHE